MAKPEEMKRPRKSEKEIIVVKKVEKVEEYIFGDFSDDDDCKDTSRERDIDMVKRMGEATPPAPANPAASAAQAPVSESAHAQEAAAAVQSAAVTKPMTPLPLPPTPLPRPPKPLPPTPTVQKKVYGENEFNPGEAEKYLVMKLDRELKIANKKKGSAVFL